MIDFNSKYTGAEAEELLDLASTRASQEDLNLAIERIDDLASEKQDTIPDLATIREGAAKGATALQSVPSEYVTESELTAKGYATTSAVNNKVDKVTGKGLSTEDFTTALKTKLEGLSNYDDTAIESAVSSLQTQLNTLVSGDANDAINSFNEIIAFLDGIKDTQDLASIIASIEQQIAGKQATIADLDTIRANAAKGATALQSVPSEYVTESELTAKGYATTSQLAGKQDTISDLATIRSGAALGATALQTETYKGTVTGVKMNGTTKNPSSGVVDLGTVITSHQDISGKQDKLVSGTNIKTINNTSILGSGNISITGGSGTITGVSANGTSVATSGVANIPAATTSKYGVTQLSSSTSSTSTSVAATPSAVKAAYDLANGKQDKLVSGTNIKTINGTSILGSGNITISGGSSSGGSGAYAQVNHGTSDTTFTLTPNTFHVWDEVASLTLTLGSETAGVANEYVFQFTSGATATSLTLPDDIKWANDSAPTIAENKIYQVSILKGMASVLEFDNTRKVATISFKIRNLECIAEEGMTWEQWVSSEYNTINCSLMGNNVIRMGEVVGTSYTSYVTKTDVITSDFAYVLIPMT